MFKRSKKSPNPSAHTKKAPLKLKIRHLKSRFFSAYYSNPAKDLKIIAVTGDATARNATAQLILSALKTKDTHAGIVSEPKSISGLYKKLYKIWRTGADHAVISVSSSALANHICYGLPIHIAVLTDTHTTNGLDAQSILFNTSPSFSLLNRDDPNFALFARYPARSATLSFGIANGADLHVNSYKLYKKGTEANFSFNHDTFDTATFFTGENAVHYLAAAVLAALVLDISTDQIVDGIADFEPSQKDLPKQTATTTNSAAIFS